MDHEEHLLRLEKLIAIMPSCRTDDASVNSAELSDAEDVYKWLPIQTQDEFLRIEHLLLDDGTYKLLISKLKRLGGSDYKDCIKRMLKKIMTDNVMMLFSFSGHKGKKRFCGSKICDALLGAVQECAPDASMKEIELKVSIYLTKAKERVIIKEKKLDN
ncbi:unnamed protein product [Callosobruchus maculatus]|uniref:DUF4806 domain-containing protein n=1 Tax=Callosobruchus maculatus TaxID=64391 RepID=A0A653DLM4_CALMS|nr:unnamed protein product [Callosobruchus maculatus]